MKNRILIVVVFMTVTVLASSCAHRDCQGNKHRVKTEMGGYL